jgi:Na+/proline symporter
MTPGVRAAIVLFAVATIAASFAIGWWARRKVSSARDFFGATALFGPVVVSLSTVAAVASAFAVVGVPALIYKTGNTMAFWMLGSASFALAYMVLGKKVRALAELGEVASLGDLSDLRFGGYRPIKGLMSVILFLGCINYLASQVQAASVLFGHLFGWPPLLAGAVIFGILTAYTALSGEVGGLLTQAFQGLVMVVAGVILIVAFFAVSGGFGAVLDAATAVEARGGLEGAPPFGPGFLDAWGTLPAGVAMAWMLIPIVGVMGQPQVLTRMYALKDPRDMPRTALYGAAAHMIVGFMAIVVGYGAIYLVASGRVAPLLSADQAIFVFADEVGLIAQLFVYAAVLAAAMSSASLFLSLSANLLARDLPSALGLRSTPEAQVRRSRVAIVVLGLGSIAFAIASGEMVAILGTFGWGTLMAATFPVFIVGLLWKGATSRAVALGLVVALVLNLAGLALDRVGFIWPGAVPFYVPVVAASVVVTVLASFVLKEPKERRLGWRVEAAMDL